MVALPCCYLTLRAQKPRSKAYPKILHTIGDHLRKRRLDLGLRQKDVAVLVNATTSTVTNWEKNRTRPRLYVLPKIYDFLGYNPIQGNATTFGEKIRQYRIQKGLSLRKLAKELNVDPGTLARWEKGRSSITSKIRGRIESFVHCVK